MGDCRLLLRDWVARMAVEGGTLAGRLQEPRLRSGGCWHRFSLPAGPHQVRVLITGRPLVLRAGGGRWG